MTKTKITLVFLCLFFISLININVGFSQEELYLGGRIDIHTYPEAWFNDYLVKGEGKHIGFPLANYSANEIVRSCKLFIVSESGSSNVIWEEVVVIPAWDFIEIVISGCDNLVNSDAGNYQLYLLTEHSNNINDVNIGSVLVPVVDGGSGAQNPHPIEIKPAGFFDSGCTDYYVNFIAPNNSTTWIAGETYEIKWEGNVDEQVNFVALALHEGNAQSYEINYNTENDGSYFYTVPENVIINNNYYITMFSNDGPYINKNSDVFTIQDQPGTAIVQLTSMTVPSEFQKGEPVEMEAVFYNIGNADFVGELFLSFHDQNLAYITDLNKYVGFIAPGSSVTLSFVSESVQSDVGNYFVVAKYFDSTTGQLNNLNEQATKIVGMIVDGEDLSDPNGTTTIVYSFNDIVTPSSIENVDLRSFIVVENTITGEVSINEMLNNNNKAKNNYYFNLDYSFLEGSYEVNYVAFYDWGQKKTKQKMEIKNIGNLPWYCFWGASASFNISEPEFILYDMTNYINQEEPISNYNAFVFTLKIDEETQDLLNNSSVQMRFYNTSSGEITTEDMYYVEAVDLWFLEKEFYSVCNYDYRFLLNYNETVFSYPSPSYSALTIEVLPFFDILPMNETGVIYETQYLFYSQVYAENPSESQIFLHTRNPSYSQNVVELDNNINQEQYFYWISNFGVAGYYEYYFEAIATNGQHFFSDTSNFFVGFGETCDYLQMPGFVSRNVWCPGCVNNNPGNGVPTHIIIHDTKINNIYELYENDINNGLEDIRYHYLIADNGLIYEGLDGGPNKRADHFNCMNGHTISIGFLNNFNVNTPSSNTLNSFDLLLKYLCSEYQIDPNGIADHVFYDFVNNTWGLNEDMPQINLHDIAGFYPEYACNINELENCPGINFPSLEESVLPFVNYCPEISQHTNVELGANIDIEISGSEKSNNKNINISTEVLSLNNSVIINLRAILCKDNDSLLIQILSEIVVLPNVNTIVDFKNNLSLDDGLYEAIVQYQTSDTSMWVSLSSELYKNEVDVAVGNTDIYEIKYIQKLEKNKKFYLFPNPNDGYFELNFNLNNTFKNRNISRSVYIYNITGQLVFTKKLEEKNHFDLNIIPGFYVLKVYENIGNNSYIFVEKLIIK